MGNNNLPTNQLTAEMISTKFREMSPRNKDILLALLVSRVSNLFASVTTGTIIQLFGDFGVSMLSNKKALHKRVVKVKGAFDRDLRDEEVKKMFSYVSMDNVPNRNGGLSRQKVWVMNDDGFVNLLMDIPGKSDEIILMKNDVLQSLKFVEHLVASLCDRRYENLMFDMMVDYDGMMVLTVQDLMKIQKEVTTSDAKHYRRLRKKAMDRRCTVCDSYDHSSIDCPDYDHKS